METTWDGAPVSAEKPQGVTIVVYRESAGSFREFLILHRAHTAPEDGEDWAWTPPSGARHPGEDPDGCARRELEEETGLKLDPVRTDLGSEAWWIYVAEAPAGAQIRLSVEHDRFEWVPVGEAGLRCRPAFVGEQIRRAAAQLDSA